MPDPRGITVAYVGSTLPSLSETFVWGEAMAVERLGAAVVPVSVHRPSTGLGSPELDEMARQAVPVYGDGAGTLLRDAVASSIASPFRSVAVMASAMLDALTQPDLPIRKRPKVIWQAFAGLALGKRLAGRGITHIHAHMAHVPTTIAMYAAHRLDVPFSFTGHANDLFRERSMLEAKLKRSAFVACISHWHRGYYRDIAGLPDDRMPVVRCGVDLPAHRHEPILTGQRTPRVLAVGRLVKKKGFDLIIQAAGQLAASGVDLHVDVIGDGPERAPLERVRADANAESVVTFHGAQPNDRVRAMLAETDVFALPCRVDPDGDRDGIPVALMEAMAAGVLVISGDLPTIRELIADGRTGRLVQTADAEPLTAALGEALRDVEHARAMAAAGRTWVAEEFERGENASRLVAMILKSAQARHAAGPVGDAAKAGA